MARQSQELWESTGLVKQVREPVREQVREPVRAQEQVQEHEHEQVRAQVQEHEQVRERVRGPSEEFEFVRLGEMDASPRRHHQESKWVLVELLLRVL